MRRAIAALLFVSAAAVARPDAVTDRLTALVDDGLAAGFPGFGLYVETRDGRSETIVRGVADVGTGAPLQPQHRYLSFSITKTMVAALVFKLIEAGQLNLGDKMVDVLDPALVAGITNAHEVNVGHLLNHSSGIFDIFDDPDFRQATNGASADLSRHWTPAELISYAYNKPALSPVGNQINYSNTGYDLLGLIIERKAGKPLHQVLSERIFAPLGMSDSFLAGHGTPQKAYIKGYAPNLDLLRHAGFDYPFPVVGDGSLIDVSALNYSYEWAAGGVVTSLADLARFARALFRGQLVSPAHLTQMKAFTPSRVGLGVGQFTTGYGLEALGTPEGPAVGHTGDGLGYMTMMFEHQGDGTLVIAFGNSVVLSADYLIRVFAESVDAARSPAFGNQ